jgi:acetyltransferase-like isoleucine patch superfamily enzyme
MLGARFGAQGLQVGRGVLIRGEQNISLGDGVKLGDRIFLCATGSRGRISIGPQTSIDVGSILYGEGGLVIGADCAIAAGVTIYTQTNRYHPRPEQKVREQGPEYAEVKIGDDVWLGMRSAILPGVKIGDHAVVGAGAVVTQDVEQWKVVVGVPARVVGDRRDGK